MSLENEFTEEEIDQIVAEEGDDDTAWEAPVQVHKSSMSSLLIPTELAQRAAFLARLHREANVDAWLARVIEERIELEEGAFGQAKRTVALQSKTVTAP